MGWAGEAAEARLSAWTQSPRLWVTFIEDCVPEPPEGVGRGVRGKAARFGIARGSARWVKGWRCDLLALQRSDGASNLRPPA